VTGVWSRLAADHGARACVSTAMTEAQIAEMTARQWETIGPLITAERQAERPVRTVYADALDYGCGAGRFTELLMRVAYRATGYDPCREMIDLRPPITRPGLWYTSDHEYLLGRNRPFDLIFVAMVLGGPQNDRDATMAEIASLLAPGGLLVLLDHMPEKPPVGRWWSFLPVSHYVALCARHGIALRVAGEVEQGANPVTICMGRRSPGRPRLRYAAASVPTGDQP
jgi:SAM-dependent methyltransferase